MYVWFSLTEWRTYQFKLPHPPTRGDIGPLTPRNWEFDGYLSMVGD